MRRWFFNLLSGLSLLLCVAVLTLWIRGQSVTDQLSWTYDRYLPDRSAASNQVHLGSDQRALWLFITWGHVGPYNGQLVWGYYVNADQSGGRPLFRHQHERYDEMNTWGLPFTGYGDGIPGWGPLRWLSTSRTMAKDGDDGGTVNIGVSYWLIELLLVALPLLWFYRFRKFLRARNLGLCPTCGYDLRASSDRCPECGSASRKTTGSLLCQLPDGIRH